MFLVKQLRPHPQHTLCHSVFVLSFAVPTMSVCLLQYETMVRVAQAELHARAQAALWAEQTREVHEYQLTAADIADLEAFFGPVVFPQ